MNHTERQDAAQRAGRGDWVQVVLWVVGLLIAAGAAALTAHGVFSAASDSGVPGELAWIYPAITDGLALLAYAATPRLSGAARVYAWTVVVLCAGLSGLAQAVYLAAEPPTSGVPAASAEAARVAAVPGALRVGVGAWPAIAAAIVAHLLFLFGHTHTTTTAPHSGAAAVFTDSTAATGRDGGAEAERPADSPAAGVHPPGVQHGGVQPAGAGGSGVQPGGVQPVAAPGVPAVAASGVQPPPGRAGASPQRAKAERVARTYVAVRGCWPSVSELAAAAEVSRGSAHNALTALRQHPDPDLSEVHPSSQEATS